MEKNGKGKEYYNSELKFEGEYLNGRRYKGKGKVYNFDNSELEFEGEFLNGRRRNGKGKEYEVDCNLKFEGEYLNGERKGGKEYYNDEIIFEGEWGRKRGKEYSYYGDL